MTALQRFVNAGLSGQLLLLRAVAALLWAKLQVRYLPFSRIAAGLGQMQPPVPAIDPAPIDEGQVLRARRIAWAIAAVARRLPFECTCLVRALAARALCQWSGIRATLHLGAQSGQAGTAETHAWLDASGVAMTGYPLPPDMVEVGCFPG